jgi:N-acetylglutamate synthase-like GNAT family acetyltransferase
MLIKSNYKIRRAKLEDASTINRITYNTIKYVNSKDYNKKQTTARLVNRTKQIKELICDKNKDVFVILKNDKIIGSISLNLKENLLGTLYVKHNEVGKGIGKKLLKYAERYAKKKGTKYFQFDSTLTAYEFYKSQGYKTIKKVDHISNKVNIPCIRMKKIL